MVLFIGYHYSPSRNRRSILRHGLVTHKPKAFGGRQPTGVYLFSPWLRNNTFPGVIWGGWVESAMDLMFGLRADLWQVSYCGPMTPDPAVDNAVILPSVTDVTLVTGNE